MAACWRAIDGSVCGFAKRASVGMSDTSDRITRNIGENGIDVTRVSPR